MLHCEPDGAGLASLEGMTRVADALRVYDGASRMAGFAALSESTE
jgi:hypothetical protein